jgi:hypothetical protein
MPGPSEVKLEHPAECAAPVDVANDGKDFLFSLERVEVMLADSSEIIGSMNDLECCQSVISEFLKV